MKSAEILYCRIVVLSALGFLSTLVILSATKDAIWAPPIYCFAFLQLVLFPIGVMIEVAYRRLPIPLMMVLSIVLSGIIGCLAAVPVLLHSHWIG